ncbi:RNA-binding RNA annealing protein [Ascochyta rabiei]|uniref:Nucleic acid binding n=1 Tax=Didymella rabiei TaxID=5454 RepID=A0A163LWN6_DIDRA|nr:RNA-binding RNA annealing protein [Ascochyta rabiei]KZM28192.1 nucleic acid binding [Ascochyta rabiei]UPX11011.1 RNA-binding RNA annealing protein [Ascochyta rabiei]
MSESRLDQSLESIISSRKQSGRKGRGGRRPDAGRPAATAAPVGGVKKSTKQAKQPKAAPAGPAAVGGESKIMISNLPLDVEQNQLQDYFASAVGVGRPKKILMQYGPNGKSLGSATVIFNRPEQASKATTALNGVKIDNRPIRVDLLVSAANVPATKQSSLADRVTQPKKDKPKPATAAKAAPAAGKGRGEATRGRGGRGGRERQKKKTIEELDAEMADYFPTAEGGNDVMVSNGAEAAPAVAGGDTAMDDEML